MTGSVRGPILIVGSGRSGTTAVYEILCRHRSVGWFSNYTDRWPGLPQLAVLSRASATPVGGLLGRFRPIPSEGYRVWDRCIPPTTGPLPTTIATDDTIYCIHQAVEAHLRYQGRSRFINKNTRNTVRISLLDALFLDPIFIHVVRDPRATVASLLKVAWWPQLPVWCRDGVTPAEWSAAGKEPAELAAHLWVAEVRQALLDSRAIPRDRYVEVRYEDLVAQPNEKLTELAEACGLTVDRSFRRTIESATFDDRNRKFKQQLSPTQIAAVEQIVGDLARYLGYSLSSDGAS